MKILFLPIMYIQNPCIENLLKITIYIYIVGGQACAIAHVQRSEGNFEESVLSFQDGIQGLN